MQFCKKIGCTILAAIKPPSPELKCKVGDFGKHRSQFLFRHFANTHKYLCSNNLQKRFPAHCRQIAVDFWGLLGDTSKAKSPALAASWFLFELW